jgi:hypothetical protein
VTASAHAGGVRRRTTAAFVAVAALTAGAGSAFAQLKPIKPLFRASYDPENSRNVLDATADVFAGWSRFSTRYLFQPEGLVGSGEYYGGGGALYYTHKGQRVDFGITGGGWVRGYSNLRDQRYPAGYEGIALSMAFTPRTSLRMRQSFTYTGYYAYTPTLIPDIDSTSILPPTVDYFLDRRSTRTHTGGITIEHKFSERSTFGVSYDTRYADISDGGNDGSGHHTGARYQYRMTQYSTLNLGYTFSRWSYPGYGTSFISHDINTGVAYSRPLASSRRTRVGFDVSSAFVGDEGSSRFRLNGGGYIAHLLSPRWEISAIYRRRNEVVEGFAAPFLLFTDTASVGAYGSISRRISLSTWGSWAYGSYDYGTVTNHLRSLAATSTLSGALLSYLSAYVQAGTARNDFQTRAGLVQGVPRVFDSLWVRGGLTLALPLVR